MEVKTLRCPECGAIFEASDKISFCSHCGAKLYFDDGTQEINYNYNFKNEDVAKIKEIEVNKELELDKRKNEIRASKSSTVGIVIFIAIFIIGYTMLFVGIKKNSDLQEEELQNIVNEIYLDINSGEYESALIKAKSLHYTADWSDDVEAKWDDTRESLIKIIEEKMK